MKTPVVNWTFILALGFGIQACNRSNGLWNVSSPVSEVTGAALNSATGAVQGYLAATWQFTDALVGSQELTPFYSEMLSDEFTATALYNVIPVDARRTSFLDNGYWIESGDYGVQELLQARSVLLLLIPTLQTYLAGPSLADIGKVYAMVGYTEVLMAEDYCAGVTLDHAVVGGGVAFGTPLSTDSLLGVAQAHFDSALAHAAGNDTVTYWASIGLGRALLDRGQYAAASAAVSGVPLDFTYELLGSSSPSYSQTLQWIQYPYGVEGGQSPDNYYNGNFVVADREGTNGIDFISARDPRLLFDSTDYFTQDYYYMGYVYASNDTVPYQTRFYAPLKFGIPVGSATSFPLATGVEAKLITAEAALHTQNYTTMVDTLNALRANAQATYLQLDSAVHPLTADSTDTLSATSQVALMFRERAFWLFGLGNRLGDMRREVGQNGLNPDQVFPIGEYRQGLHIVAPGSGNNALPPYTTYGTDVSMTLPTAAAGETSANPSYVGCLTSTSDATFN